MSSTRRRRLAGALAVVALPALLWTAGTAYADDDPGGPSDNPTPVGPIPLATSPTGGPTTDGHHHDNQGNDNHGNDNHNNNVGFCQGDGCTGQKPELTGCDRDARTIRTGAVVDHVTGRQVGTIELRWSPHCQTNWARVTSGVGVASLAATVTRDDGTAEAITFHGTSTWSPMVFVGDNGRTAKAQATGWVNRASGSVADGPPQAGVTFH